MSKWTKERIILFFYIHSPGDLLYTLLPLQETFFSHVSWSTFSWRLADWTTCMKMTWHEVEGLRWKDEIHPSSSALLIVATLSTRLMMDKRRPFKCFHLFHWRSLNHLLCSVDAIAHKHNQGWRYKRRKKVTYSQVHDERWGEMIRMQMKVAPVRAWGEDRRCSLILLACLKLHLFFSLSSWPCDCPGMRRAVKMKRRTEAAVAVKMGGERDANGKVLTEKICSFSDARVDQDVK